MKTKEEQTEKQNLPKLKVELNAQEWEAVLAVIENSTSAHVHVKSVINEFINQLKPQIPDNDKSE